VCTTSKQGYHDSDAKLIAAVEVVVDHCTHNFPPLFSSF
jgi:hypothetical protein